MRNFEEGFFKILMIGSLVIIILVMLIIIFSVLYRGLPALSWEMITQTPQGGYYYGKEGGIFNAIAGSLYLSVCSTFISLVIALPVALYLNVFARKNKLFVNSVRFILDIMWGVPSVVYGALGFTVMIYFGLKASLFAGIITVTIFIIPIMIRAIDEVLQTIPGGLMEASLSLGANKTQTAYKVFVRQCMPGIVTAVLLSFGRGIGDAASVLFTTGYTDNIPVSPDQPAATLPLAIFFQLSSPIAEVQDRAYAAGVILLVIILIISITIRLLSKKINKNAVKF